MPAGQIENRDVTWANEVDVGSAVNECLDGCRRRRLTGQGYIRQDAGSRSCAFVEESLA